MDWPARLNRCTDLHSRRNLRAKFILTFSLHSFPDGQFFGRSARFSLAVLVKRSLSAVWQVF
jgi:hypothetical protein